MTPGPPRSSARERGEVCAITAGKLEESAGRLGTLRATLGLDGFVDQIVTVVDRRRGAEDFDPVRTIEALGHKFLAAAGRSSNYELVVRRQKLGGNGPIMANALAALGLNVTYIGNLGVPEIHPVFHELASRARVVSIGNPAQTDALEFEDGKLMLGKLSPLLEVTWDNLLQHVGKEELKRLLNGSDLIAMLNWTMLPHMSRLWAKLLDEVIPDLDRHRRRLFIDLADPEKRTSEDILDALGLLRRFQDQVDVILGLNLKESLAVADVLGLPGARDPEGMIAENAEAIRKALGLYCVVIHPRRCAACATAVETARIEGPFVRNPSISTGAGDHFNAGFCAGQLLGMELDESLCLGVALSGYYVRNGVPPTAGQLAEFVRTLPLPQPEKASDG
jgi:sugar/nucleoside kinase (ribokinase family)